MNAPVLFVCAGLALLVWGKISVITDSGLKAFFLTIAKTLSSLCGMGLLLFGALLLGSVLFIPMLQPLFQIASLSAGLAGAIIGLAFGSMIVIQILKAIRTK